MLIAAGIAVLMRDMFAYANAFVGKNDFISLITFLDEALGIRNSSQFYLQWVISFILFMASCIQIFLTVSFIMVSS